jgi:hypothetical protein
MRFKSVETQIEISNEPRYYDLAIFSSGFEKRAIHIASHIDSQISKKFIVLGFRGDQDVLSRKENDRYFTDKFGAEQLHQLGSSDDQHIFSLLNELEIADEGLPLRILVDYSVMTRSWYSAILTWARFAQFNSSIELDFAYSCGEYLGDFGPLSISEIVSLPGFEGISGGFRRTTAIFGLGYDKYATLAVYDRLEPDSVYCCIAQRYPDDENSNKVLKENDELVEASTKLIQLPLTDITLAFSLLSDLILSLERSTHIVMVPMGPKTHVLVTLLAALRMPWITCLHAKGDRSTPIQVEASGPLSLCRVIFQGD